VAVWPFDRPGAGAPTALEIFPRMLARRLAPPGGPRGAAFRAAVLAALQPAAIGAVAGMRDLALANQDAFDAAVSAITLSRDPAAGLIAGDAAAAGLEGWIWGARPS
jgi:hypothetical protein